MVTEIRDSVKTGMQLETVSSEHEVGPIMTHEMAMYLSALDSDEERIADIAEAAMQAIMGLHDSVAPFHPYIVREATRGILHGLVCAGMDVSYVSRPAAKGIREALFLLDEFSQENEHAMRAGVRDALADLGLSRIENDQALELPGYFANETMVFGRAAF